MAEFKKVIFFFFVTLLLAHDSPYSLDKFKPVLGISKLQAPQSSYNPLYSRKYGDFADYSNRYFYLQDDKYMVFYMCGNHNRSELRFKNTWKVDTESEKTLKAEVKLFPLNEKKEFTFLQIHTDGTLKKVITINKPLLRIVWYKKLRGKKNHIWAVIRLGDDIFSRYQKIDLGVMPKSFFDVKISVYKNVMKIFVNGVEKVNINVGYWAKYYNYFKAGVYLQDDGCAKVLFKNLTVKD
ncbi:polysaccharide lyase family 7 protein [Caminibacter pacificus]